MNGRWQAVLPGKWRLMILVVAIALLAGWISVAGNSARKPDEAAAIAARPALSVTLVAPETMEWPQLLSANGNVAAWQEAVIAPEISNYRISDVRVEIGDAVRKGQLLARIDSETLAAELAEAKAAVAELVASAEEAKANAKRAAELREKGFYSPQLATQYQTGEHTSAARLAAGRARLQAAELKMAKAGVLAPDDGIISARSATVGSLTQQGQELFRLIRGGRLEWRAEVASADLARLQPGITARLVGPGDERVSGTVRSVAPSVDPATRNGLVFVDLPAGSAIKSGMFARGEFELGRSAALTVPQSALVLREGYAYVFRLEGEDRVAQTKVVAGRRQGDRVEILDGLKPAARIVAGGAGFLADGDAVRVVAGAQ